MELNRFVRHILPSGFRIFQASFSSEFSIAIIVDNIRFMQRDAIFTLNTVEDALNLCN